MTVKYLHIFTNNTCILLSVDVICSIGATMTMQIIIISVRNVLLFTIDVDLVRSVVLLLFSLMQMS